LKWIDWDNNQVGDFVNSARAIALSLRKPELARIVHALQRSGIIYLELAGIETGSTS